MTNILYLNQVFSIFLDSKELHIKKILEKEAIDYYIGSIASDNQILATYHIILKNDISKAKNLYYEAAVALQFLKLKYNYWTGGVVKELFFAPLSDNAEMINDLSFLNIADEYIKAKHIGVDICNAFQGILFNKNEIIEQNLSLMWQKSKGNYGKLFIGFYTFCEGILEKNEAKIFEGVNMLQKKLQKDQPHALKDFMNFEATGLAKLAWMKGFEIDFKNKYIPQQLLPIAPLEKYESFNFYE